MDKSLKDGVVDIKWQGYKIILVKLLVGDLVLNVITLLVKLLVHKHYGDQEWSRHCDGQEP
jgi:hypothetical protein